jgi:hypothetical protein
MTCAIKLTVDGPLPLLLSGYIQESATVWRLHCYDFGVFGRSQRAIGVVELIVIPVGPMREGSRIIKPRQPRRTKHAIPPLLFDIVGSNRFLAPFGAAHIEYRMVQQDASCKLPFVRRRVFAQRGDCRRKKEMKRQPHRL